MPPTGASASIQQIDAAAMELFAVYKHFEGDYTATTATAGQQLVGRNAVRDMSMVIVGTKINF